MITDITLGLSWGDEGKGKITHHLLKSGKYTHVLRYNGGCNAGHTIYHEGKKFVTHHIPAGVFFGVKSIIGSGCVINLPKLFEEMKMLEDAGFDVYNLLKIANNCHVITDAHMREDNLDEKIGTTKSGVGPAYSAKYARTGLRAEEVPEINALCIDLFSELHDAKNVVVLCEGAQGYNLDIDWGNYPYVTSSHCSTAGALLNAIPHTSIRDTWGVIKSYDTYVGKLKFQADDEIFNKIQKAGNEFGATTGRQRQCNWLNLDLLRRAILTNGVNNIVVNKMDILEEVGVWKVIYRNEEISFQDRAAFETFMTKWLTNLGIESVHYSDSPEKI
jgi:adenylosuccinate synthase